MIENINEYQKEAHTTADYPVPEMIKSWSFQESDSMNYVYPALGLAEEAGEVAGKFAKAVRDNGGVIDEDRKAEIIKELGDVCWFVAEIATCLEIDMSLILQKNLDKLASRKARGVIHGSGDNR